jgi:hypothetical protein
MDWTRDDEGNGKMPFPYKLFQMLKDADDKGLRHFVTWNASGKSFKVHDSAAFTKYIVPKYFKQTRYKSFQVRILQIPVMIVHILEVLIKKGSLLLGSAPALFVWIRPYFDG